MFGWSGYFDRSHLLGQSHVSATAGAWPYRVLQSVILSMWSSWGCVWDPNLIGCFRIKNMSWKVTKNWPLVHLSCTVTCFRWWMYYIDKLWISHFGQWVVPNFVMAASNHMVAAIQGTGNTMTSAWYSELIYLSDLSYQRKRANFAVSQLSNAVWLAGLGTRDIQGISLFKNIWTLC